MLLAKAPDSGPESGTADGGRNDPNAKARSASIPTRRTAPCPALPSLAPSSTRSLAVSAPPSPPIVGSSSSSAMDAAYERPASSSSYFARPAKPCRLLLRVHAAEDLHHVSSHGTYCKLYVGGTEMVRGSGAFARHTQKLTSSGSSHNLGGLLHSPFGGNTAVPPTTPLPPTSSSEGDLSASGGNRMRVLKTKVQKGKSANPVWNEKFDIPVLDPVEDVLSIRVKSARLMSSPAIGACWISLKHLALQGPATVDKWVDLKHGKKDAGRIRLQMRLVDPSKPRRQSRRPEQDEEGTPNRPRNHQISDSYLSLPGEESPEEVAARALKKISRRDHKYHRSARRFDGRPVNSTVLGSSDGSNRSASDKDEDQKRSPITPKTPRDNSASATSNESIDDSEPVSDVSVSPVTSPLPKRTSNEDAAAFSDLESPSAVARPPPTSTLPPPVAGPTGLDASYANRGTMRRSELERSKMKMAELSRTSRISRSSMSSLSSNPQVPQEEDDDDLDEYDNRPHASKRWTSDDSKLSVLSSALDPRESSQMDFDDAERDSLDTRKKPVNNVSVSVVLSSTASSTLDQRENSRFSFSDSESGGEDDKDHDAILDKAREQQRQQWQMEQRKRQLAGIKEVSQSMSDSESDDDFDEDDEFDEELDRGSSRIQFTPTIAKLLCRESMNVLIEEEDDVEEEECLESVKMGDDFVPILEATSPLSVDSVDCALRRSRVLNSPAKLEAIPCCSAAYPDPIQLLVKVRSPDASLQEFSCHCLHRVKQFTTGQVAMSTENQAAACIQARFRGFRWRRQQRRGIRAVTKLQALQRGRFTRREFAELRDFSREQESFQQATRRRQIRIWRNEQELYFLQHTNAADLEKVRSFQQQHSARLIQRPWRATNQSTRTSNDGNTVIVDPKERIYTFDPFGFETADAKAPGVRFGQWKHDEKSTDSSQRSLSLLLSEDELRAPVSTHTDPSADEVFVSRRKAIQERIKRKAAQEKTKLESTQKRNRCGATEGAKPTVNRRRELYEQVIAMKIATAHRVRRHECGARASRPERDIFSAQLIASCENRLKYLTSESPEQMTALEEDNQQVLSEVERWDPARRIQAWNHHRRAVCSVLDKQHWWQTQLAGDERDIRRIVVAKSPWEDENNIWVWPRDGHDNQKEAAADRLSSTSLWPSEEIQRFLSHLVTNGALFIEGPYRAEFSNNVTNEGDVFPVCTSEVVSNRDLYQLQQRAKRVARTKSLEQDIEQRIKALTAQVERHVHDMEAQVEANTQLAREVVQRKEQQRARITREQHASMTIQRYTRGMQGRKFARAKSAANNELYSSVSSVRKAYTSVRSAGCTCTQLEGARLM
uniref:C2 domain-containing protein n=1 Tax=Phytophthora fragariae TaxID=53985 RepID=A0A6A3EPY5_9STRA|nr:hypothetical protein PF009_g16054 [Phytophthora fragariae]